MIEHLLTEIDLENEYKAELEAERIHAAQNYPYARTNKQNQKIKRKSPYAHKYYTLALGVLSAWSRRHIHGLITTRKKLAEFNELCTQINVQPIDEGWLKQFVSLEKCNACRRKLFRLREKSSEIIPLRTLD